MPSTIPTIPVVPMVKQVEPEPVKPPPVNVQEKDPFESRKLLWNAIKAHSAGMAQRGPLPPVKKKPSLSKAFRIDDNVKAVMDFFDVAMGITTPGSSEAKAAEAAANYRLDVMVKADWFIKFYDLAPELIRRGKISSLEEYGEWAGDPAIPLSEDELAEAQKVFESIDGKTPEWLKIDPKKEAQVREFFQPKVVKTPPNSLQRLTVNAILKSLSPQLPPTLPEGMAAEELLRIGSLLDLSPETLEGPFDIDTAMQVIRDADLQMKQMIADARAGIAEWKVPKMSTWDRMMFSVQSPLRAFADFLGPYIRNVSHPLAGMASMSIARLLPGTQGIEKEFNKRRAEGANIWSAHGEAFEAWDLTWYYKLPIELVTDPLTYIPGVGLKVPGKILQKVGLKTLGTDIIKLNEGIWEITDIPFDAAKHLMDNMAIKTTKQRIIKHMDEFTGTVGVAATKVTGKSMHQLNKDDFILTLQTAAKAFADTPNLDGNVLVDLGRYMSDHIALTDNQVYQWSKQHGGALTPDIDAQLVSQVNQVLTDFSMKVGSRTFNARRLATYLHIEETAENIAKLEKEIPATIKKLSTDLDVVMRIGKNSDITPVTNMLEYIVQQQRDVIVSKQVSKQAKGKFLEGVMLGLQHNVDKLEAAKWRQTFDIWLVKPLAEANLGNVAYPLWNGFEGIGMSLIEGVIPKSSSWEAYIMMTKGLFGDTALAEKHAGDVAGMFSTSPNRRAGAYSLLPGKTPESIGGVDLPLWVANKDWFEWTGRNWIKLSEQWGNNIKRNYVSQKMMQHMSRLLRDNHPELFDSLRKAVKGAPKIPKGTLGVTTHDLERDLFRRAMSSVKDMLDMKDVVTDGSLMAKETDKIIDHADWLSPRAKATAKQWAREGKLYHTRVSYTQAGGGLTPEAIDLLAKVEQGGVPAFVTNNLRRIAVENGIEVGDKTPNEIIELLKSKQSIKSSPTDGIAESVDQIFAQSIEDMWQQPKHTGDVFNHLATTINNTTLTKRKDLLEVFTHFETLSETAAFMPHRLMSGLMRETDILYKANKFNKVRALWEQGRQDMISNMDSITASLEIVKRKILDNTNLLTPKQRSAIEAVLARSEASQMVRDATLKLDAQLLDNFWARPKAERTAEAHVAIRAKRSELWATYEREVAIPSAGEFITRQKVSELYHGIPKQKLKPVDASNRALSTQDVADLFGVNIDGITQGLMDTLAMHGKSYFIQLVKQSADKSPDAFRGFTEDKIASVYDHILRQANMNPEGDILTQKMLLQAEGMKQELAGLKMRHSLLPEQKSAIDAWIDNAVAVRSTLISGSGVDLIKQKAPSSILDELRAKLGTFEPKVTVPKKAPKPEVPDYDIGLGEKIVPTDESEAAYQKWRTESTLGKSYPNDKIAREKYFVRIEGNTIIEPDEAYINKLKAKVTEAAKSVHIPGAQTLDDIRTAIMNDEEILDLIFPITDLSFNNIDTFIAKLGSIEALLSAQAYTKSGKLVPEVYARWHKVDALKRELSGVRRGEDTLESVMRDWFGSSDNKSLQLLGRIAEKTPEYLAKIRGILNEKYPSGYIRIYRGTGAARGKFLEREYTNVTSSRKIALNFEDTWVPGIGSTPSPEVYEAAKKPVLDNVLVKVDDIVSIGSVDESELIIPAKVLRDRIENPITPEKFGQITEDTWQSVRQLALDAANKDYYKAFADYTHENMFGTFMKMIFPYWTYAQYRWFALPRQALRHPGLPVAWGKYQDYGENGFIPSWFPDLEMNPFVGSMVGTTFTLTRADYASYYEQLGWAGEVMDYTQRWGFYPNAPITAAVSWLPTLAGRKAEFGGILPPPHRTGIDLFVASNIPGVSKAAQWLKDHIFHENFHEYYTATILDSIQVEAGGTLIDGQTGTDLWFKMLRKEKLTEEEKELWDRAYRKASGIGALRAQFPQFRLKTDDYKEAYDQVSKIIEEQLGMSEEFQRDLWKHHKRPTDVVGGLPLHVQAALDEIWQWKVYFSRSTILAPPGVSDLKALIDKYWNKIESYQTDRLGRQADLDKGFLTPTLDLHFTGNEWRSQFSANWSDYVSKSDKLETEPEFADAVEALTPAGQLKLAKRLGYTVVPDTPLKEAVNLYFDITLDKKANKYTGEIEDDFLTFWLKREAVRMALTTEQRDEFDTYIRRYQTPMEQVFHYAYNTYIRGYKSADRIIYEKLQPQDQAIIQEFYATTTSLTRKEELRAEVGKDGRQIISGYESARSDARSSLRVVSPTLDFWLYVFGYTTTTKTDQARNMVDSWESDRTSILDR